MLLEYRERAQNKLTEKDETKFAAKEQTPYLP